MQDYLEDVMEDIEAAVDEVDAEEFLDECAEV